MQKGANAEVQTCKEGGGISWDHPPGDKDGWYAAGPDWPTKPAGQAGWAGRASQGGLITPLGG